MCISRLKFLFFTFAFTVSASAIAESGPSREQTIDYIEMMRLKYGPVSAFSITEDREYLMFDRTRNGMRYRSQIEVANVERVMLRKAAASYVVGLMCREYVRICIIETSVDNPDFKYIQKNKNVFIISSISNENETLARKVAKAYIHLFKFYGVELILEDKIVKEDLF